MSKQPEALRLADVNDLRARTGWAMPRDESALTAAELRRLHAINAELLEALQECADRLQIHIKHTEDLVAHMKACKAIAKAGEQP